MASVEDVLITPQLAGRPTRVPDHAAEARALSALVAELAERPHQVLQKLTDTIVELCLADSAGVSIVDGGMTDPHFRWPAVSGAWADKTGGTMPIDASPCSVVIARKTPLLFEHPERFFAVATQGPPIHEILLVPFGVGGEVVGTLWAIAHDAARKFDAEDARLLGNLADFASAACQAIAALDAAEAAKDVLEARVADRTRALAKSEERLRTLFDAIDEGFVEMEMMLDAAGHVVDWRWLAFNPAFERMSGLKGVEGRLFSEIVPALEPEWAQRYEQVMTTGEAQRFELPVGNLGSWFDVFVSRIGGEGSRRLAVVFNNITNRKRAEAALRESEDRQVFLLRLSDALRPLREAGEIQQAAIDLLGEHMAVNRAGYYEVGHDQDVFFLTARWERDATPLPDRMVVSEFGDDIRAGYLAGRTLAVADTELQTSSDDELAAVRAIGVRAWIGVPLVKAGRWVAAVGVHSAVPRDWTPAEISLVEEVGERTWAAVERARAEAALRHSELQLTTAFDVLPVGIGVMDAGGTITLANPAMARYLPNGIIPSRDAEQRTRWRVVGADGVSIAPSDWPSARALRGERALPGLEMLDTGGDGAQCWTSVSSAPVRNGAGEVSGAVVAIHDLTAFKAAERALRVIEERHTFLLRLSDALRPLEDAREIERTAVDMLGRKLGASRVFYATIERDGDTGLVRHAYTDGVADGVGRYSLASFRPARVPEWQAGQTTMTYDSETDPAFGEVERAAYASVSSRAAVGVPLVKRGRLVALFAVNQSTPREWTASEIELIREVGERAWAALERSRTEAALRDSEERLRQFGENSPDVLWILDVAAGRLEYLSSAYETIWGEPRERVMDDLDHWRSHLHPADQARVAEGIPQLMTGKRHSMEYRIFRPDGEQRWIFDTGFAITDDAGQVIRVAGVAQDVTARREAEDRVRESELRFRVLSEGMPQLVWRSCDEGMWTWSSPQWRDFTGQTVDESLGRGWLDAIHPDDHARELFAWSRAPALGELAVEYRIHRAADDAWLWHQTRSVPVRDDEGRTLEWLGTSTDVEDLHRMREHERLLLGELQHRVRNSLAVVRSIARRTADVSGTVDEFAAHLDGRLSAFARAQAVVTRDPSRGIDLRELIDDELAAVAARQGHNLRVEGPAVRLWAKAGETLALAFHELATNAVKYGALANGHRLSIVWRIDDENGEPCLIIDWREHLHNREIAPPTYRGFGMDLLEQTLEYELDADIAVAFPPFGLVCTIRVPLAGVGSSAPASAH